MPPLAFTCLFLINVLLWRPFIDAHHIRTALTDNIITPNFVAEKPFSTHLLGDTETLTLFTVRVQMFVSHLHANIDRADVAMSGLR